jgi:hypothetical protein
MVGEEAYAEVLVPSPRTLGSHTRNISSERRSRLRKGCNRPITPQSSGRRSDASAYAMGGLAMLTQLDALMVTLW